jgi:type III pantothenate kinase
MNFPTTFSISLHTMQLVLDIGNTRIKMAVFDKKKLVEKHRLTACTAENIQAILEQYPIKKIAYIASGADNKNLLDWLKTRSEVLEINEHTPISIKNCYKTPHTLGKDRLAGAVAAATIFPRKNVLFIDCGTCTTYNFVTQDAEFLGGNITSGIDMRLKAMHTFTAKLPLVTREITTNIVGDDTLSALRTGAQLGAAFEMEGFIRAYQQNFGAIKVILTGGDAVFFQNALKINVLLQPDLVLYGVNLIIDYWGANLRII